MSPSFASAGAYKVGGTSVRNILDKELSADLLYQLDEDFDGSLSPHEYLTGMLVLFGRGTLPCPMMSQILQRVHIVGRAVLVVLHSFVFMYIMGSAFLRITACLVRSAANSMCDFFLTHRIALSP